MKFNKFTIFAIFAIDKISFKKKISNDLHIICLKLLRNVLPMHTFKSKIKSRYYLWKFKLYLE